MEAYYTNAKSGQGFDVLMYHENNKFYDLYYNVQSKSYLDNLWCDLVYLEMADFENKIESLKKSRYKMDDCIDAFDYNPYRWNRFYTTSVVDDDINDDGDDYYDDYDDDDYDDCYKCVDQIEIDLKRREYVLYLNADDRITDGYDMFYNEMFSTYLDREIFDLVVEGIKAKGFKCLYEDDKSI